MASLQANQHFVMPAIAPSMYNVGQILGAIFLVPRFGIQGLVYGVIIGAAFGKIVTSLVSDVLMPPLGLLMGKVDFSSLFINLSGSPQPSLTAAKAAGAPTVNYGVFLQTVFDFTIIAFVIFMLVKQINRFKKEAPPAPPAGPTNEEKLLMEIRDALKDRR